MTDIRHPGPVPGPTSHPAPASLVAWRTPAQIRGDGGAPCACSSSSPTTPISASFAAALLGVRADRIADDRGGDLGGRARAQSRRRFHRRRDDRGALPDPAEPRSAVRVRCRQSRHVGEAALQHIRRAQRRLDPPAAVPFGRRGRHQQAWCSDVQRRDLKAQISGRAVQPPPKPSRARSRASSIRNGLLAVFLAVLGIAVFSWLRYEWQFGISTFVAIVARRAGNDGLLRADPARIRSQHRRRRADDHRLFDQRQDRDRRPHP